jgi:hypothetical protein
MDDAALEAVDAALSKQMSIGLSWRQIPPSASAIHEQKQ